MAAKKKTVHLPISVMVDDELKAPGEPVTVDSKEADELVKRHGEIEPKEKGAKAKAPAKPKRPTGVELEQAIGGAIGSLDPENEDHFTASGKPIVAELEKRLGYYLDADERDAVWAKISDAKASNAAAGS